MVEGTLLVQLDKGCPFIFVCVVLFSLRDAFFFALRRVLISVLMFGFFLCVTLFLLLMFVLALLARHSNFIPFMVTII